MIENICIVYNSNKHFESDIEFKLKFFREICPGIIEIVLSLLQYVSKLSLSIEIFIFYALVNKY